MNIEPIFNFLFNNLKTKKRKLIINKIKNVQDLKNKIIFGKYNILIIKKKSNKAIKIINLFSFLFKTKNFNKNFFILYKFKNHLSMYNFFPDWTGRYIDQPYFINLFTWLKMFLSILYYRNYIEYFIFTKNDNIN